MKTQLSFTVNRVANGIIITANLETKQLQLIAKDESEAKEQITKLVDEHLTPANETK